ncbi:MAG: hypothetical protein AAFY83_06960 [Pseudomonadota bacterium]
MTIKKQWLQPVMILSSVAAVGLVIEPVQAQDAVSIEEALQICNRVGDPRDKLDCFEGLADAAAPPPTQKENGSAPSKKTDVSKGETNQAPTPPTADETDPQTQSGAQAKPKAKKRRFVILPAEEAEERLARELTPREKGNPYEGTIRKAWTNGAGKLFVLLANGELWKQSETGRVKPPKAGSVAALKKSRFGNWFVRFPSHYRSVRMKIINAEKR